MSATCSVCQVYDQTTTHFILKCDRSFGCWKKVERLVQRLEPNIELDIEVEDVVNGFPKTRATREGKRQASTLKTFIGAAIYAMWIAYTQCEFDGKTHSVSSVVNLMRSMVGRQIRNEYAVAVAHGVVEAFGLKWGGNPGLAKVTFGKLGLCLV